MSEVTRILNQIEQGDPSATDELLPLVYEELRVLARHRMAHEKPGQTLQATALVHEAYLRLVGKDNDQCWDNRGHFFAAAAVAMRRILVNRARDKGCIKRGGTAKRVDLELVEFALDATDDHMLAIDEALDVLSAENPQCAEVVKLRFFAGLSIEETASALGISPSSVKRHWAYARAWLFDALRVEN